MSAPDPVSTPVRAVPERPSLDGLEAKWDAAWEARGTYRFDRTKARHDVYAIDTPPPTVSGSLHLGTVFGYVQFDSIARFWRMRGKEVFFPVGWDDNGLPTERRVQNHYGVRCDPTLPYDPDARIEPEADARAPGRPAQLHRALRGADRRGRAHLRAGVPRRRPLRRLGADLHHHQRALAANGPARLPAQPGPRRGLRQRGADDVGRRLPDGGRPGRDGGPADGRRLSQAVVPPGRGRRHRDRHDAPGAAGGLRGRRRPPRRRPLVGPRRHRGHHPALRRPRPGRHPCLGRPGEGDRRRHDLHLRRLDRRRVVARARPPHSARWSSATGGSRPSGRSG